MRYLFIYLFICGSFFFFFFFSLWGGRGEAQYTCRAGCGAVLAYMCYSCSNIVDVSIHIHAFKKTCCVHGSVVSLIVLPSYSDHRRGDLVTLDVCVHVCL